MRRELRQVAPFVAMATALLVLTPAKADAQHHRHRHSYSVFSGTAFRTLDPAFYYSAWYGPGALYAMPWGPWPAYAYYDRQLRCASRARRVRPRCTRTVLRRGGQRLRRCVAAPACPARRARGDHIPRRLQDDPPDDPVPAGGRLQDHRHARETRARRAERTPAEADGERQRRRAGLRTPARNRIATASRPDKPLGPRQPDSARSPYASQPAGASVIVDGERWEGPEEIGERLVMQLSRGTPSRRGAQGGLPAIHHGVEVRSGETATLNVSLPPERH